MNSGKQLSLIAFFALSLSAAAAPMRDPGGRPAGTDRLNVSESVIGPLERKSPGWFGGPKTDSAKTELELARSLEKSGELRQASKRYNAIVKQWGSSPQAADAQKAYADLMVKRDKMEKAFRAYQYLIKYYAGQFDYDEVLTEQMKIANLMMTTRREFLFVFGFMAPERAIPYYRQIVANGPKWKRAPEAQFNIGLISEEIGDLEEAVLAYDAVMSGFRGHSLASDAAFRRAVCLLKLWKKTPRNERSLRNALSALASFLANYPSNENAETAADHIAELRERLAEMYFDRAEFYEKVDRNDKAALIAYSEFVRQFPTSGKAAKAKERIEELKSKQKAEE